MPFDHSISHQPTGWMYLNISSSSFLHYTLQEVPGHTIRKVHSDIYQLVTSSVLEWDHLPAFFAAPLDTFPSFFKSILSHQPFILPQSRRERMTYTQTPSLPSLFLTFNWKIPLVCPFSITPWEISCLNMGGTDLLDCIFLCLVVHLLEDICESLTLVW